MQRSDLERFDPRAVAWFERIYGAALVANVATEIASGVWRVHTGELYPWRHVPIVPLYPAPVLAIEWLVAGASGALLMARRGTRTAWRAAAAATLAAVLQRFSNHGALLFLVALFVAIDPPRPNAPGFAATPRPNLGLVRAQLLIVYAFSAINKIARGFLTGSSIANLLGVAPGAARAASIAVVAAEIAIPVVLLARPRAGIACVGALHLAFAVGLPELWSFSLLMIAMAVTFLPARPRRSSFAST
jgi:hypothetical protein